MPKITRDSIMTLEDYAKSRQDFRTQVMLHKKNRKVPLGKNVTLIFEDELTIRYQIQEMLRIEKIFEEEGIVDEIEAYKALIPDGRNWKATMMIEYGDVEERKQAQRPTGHPPGDPAGSPGRTPQRQHRCISPGPFAA